MSTPISDSPLAQATADCGAIFFSTEEDWRMPATYGDPDTEYRCARSDAVVRDVSNLSLLSVTGCDHLDFLHRMTTNDFLELEVGVTRWAVFPDNRGRILELTAFCRVTEKVTLAISAPQARQRLPEWLDRYLFTEDVRIEDRAGELAALEICGPTAGAAVRSVFGVLTDGSGAGLLSGLDESEPWVLAQGLPGALPGYRIVGEPTALAESWSQLAAMGVIPIGEETAEILRIETGIPASGAELTEDHNPWEAGLDDAVHMDKGCYIGQEVIARLDTYDKVKQRMVGILLDGGPQPSSGHGVFADDRQIGQVTSAATSPGMARPIALAYVRSVFCTPGTAVTVSAGSGASGQPGQVSALPFAVEA